MNKDETALIAQMAYTWDAFWTRTGGHGSTTHAWEEVLAAVRKFDEENKPTVPLERVKMWVGDIAGCVRENRWSVAAQRLIDILSDLGITVASPNEPFEHRFDQILKGIPEGSHTEAEAQAAFDRVMSGWQDAQDDPDSIK